MDEMADVTKSITYSETDAVESGVAFMREIYLAFERNYIFDFSYFSSRNFANIYFHLKFEMSTILK